MRSHSGTRWREKARVGRLRQGRGEGRGEAAAPAEGRSVRPEQRAPGGVRLQADSSRIESSVVGRREVRGEQSHLGSGMMLFLSFMHRAYFY